MARLSRTERDGLDSSPPRLGQPAAAAGTLQPRTRGDITLRARGEGRARNRHVGAAAAAQPAAAAEHEPRDGHEPRIPPRSAAQ